MIDKIIKLFGNDNPLILEIYKKSIKKDKNDSNHYEIETHIKYNNDILYTTYHLYKVYEKKDLTLFFKNFQYYNDLFDNGNLYLILDGKYRADLLEYWKVMYQEITKIIDHPYYSRIRENIFIIIYYNNQWLEYKGEEIKLLPPLKIN